jgi:hypothetical protein
LEGKRAEEVHLLPLLKDQFPEMADSYINNLKALLTKADACSNLQWYTDNAEPLFFRFDIDMPAFFLLSEPLSRFQAYKQYIVPMSEEHKFYANLGIIPAYFANLNRISCVKLWGNQALGFFAPYSQPLRGENESVWQFGTGLDNPAKFSSLNFVLRNGATEADVPDYVRTALSDYFQYAFWSFPKKGFGSCAHIIHSRETINHILKVAKGLYLVKYINEARLERLGPYYYGWVQKVELETFNRQGESIVFSVYMAKDIVRKIWMEMDSEKKSDLLLNGLIYDFRAKDHGPNEKLKLLSVAAGFMPDDIELIKTLTCLCAAEKFRFDQETLGHIGTIDSVRYDVSHKYSHFARSIEYSTSILGSVESPLDYLIEELYPIVVQDGQEVYFVHPIILSALSALDRVDSIKEKNKTILVNFIRLLEKLKLEKEFQTLRFTDEAEYFKKIGVDFSSLCSVLRLAFKNIILSKLLNEFF